MAREELTIEINADNRASRALRRLKGQMRDLGGTARRMGRLLAGALAAGTAAATAAIGAFTKSVISVGSESEQARIRLDSLFGSAEEGAAAFDAVRSAAARLPFTFSEILGVSSTLSVISDDAGELRTRIMQAAEISARFGLSLEETASNMVRFFTAGANSADLFRERGVLAAIGVQAGMKTSVQESVRLWQDFFTRIEEQGTSATARLAESWEGSVSMLQDLWREFRQTVSDEGVLDAFKEILAGLREQMEQFIESGAAARFARGFADMLTAVMGTVSEFLFTMIGAIGTDAGEAFRNLGLMLGARLGQGIFAGLEALLREANILAKIPGPVGDIFDTINVAALGAEQLANLARDSAEEAAAGLRILAEAGGSVEGIGDKLQAEVGGLTGGGGASGGGRGGAGTAGPTEPSVVDAFLRSFGIPSVDELRQAIQRRFNVVRQQAATIADPLSTPGFQGFGGFRAEGAAAMEFGGFSGQLTGQEDFSGLAAGFSDQVRGQGAKAGEEFSDSMGSTMEQGGRFAIRSLVDGLLRGVDDAEEFLRNIGIQLASMLLTQGLFSALGIASPSSEGRWAGRQVGLGLALGLEDMFGRVSQAAAGLGRAAIPDVSGPSMRALGSTAAAGPVNPMGGFDASQLQPLSRWAVANDPAFQSLLSASDQIGEQTGRVRRNVRASRD